MATTNSIKYNIEMNVSSSSTSKLQQLGTSLQNIQKSAETLKATMDDTRGDENLNRAAEAAKTLQSALSQAYNQKLNTYDISKLLSAINSAYGSTKNFGNAIAQAGETGVKVFQEFQTALIGVSPAIEKNVTLLDKMAETMSNTVK